MDLISTQTGVRCLLELSQNNIPTPLVDSEVIMVTDIEFYLKAFIYNCVETIRHA